MRRQIKIGQSVFPVVVAGLFLAMQLLGLRPLHVAAAGTANLYLTPASATVIVGNNVTVGIYEDSGTDSVNAVQANLTYSTSQLTFVSYASSPAFNIEAQSPSGDTGTLNFARATLTPKTGAQLVANVTFKAASSSGTAQVSFSSGSSVIRSTDNGSETLTTTGGSYMLTPTAATSTSTTPAPSSSTPPASSSSPPKSTSSTAPAAQANPSDKTAPVISSIAVSKITDSGAVITWDTSEAATSIVKYGLNTKNELVSSDTTLVSKHQISLGAGTLTADTTYYFTVNSTDASGNAASGPSMTFHTLKAANARDTNETMKLFGKNASTLITLSLGVLALIAAVTIITIIYKRRSLAAAELDRHFVKAAEPAQQPIKPATIQPTPKPQEPNNLAGPKK